MHFRIPLSRSPFLGLTLLLALVACIGLRAEDWTATYDRLLQTYVTPKGVRYQAWHAHAADRKALTQVTEAIGQARIAGQPKPAQLAFYLNAYNAWILKKILDAYPTKGPGGGGFIGRTRFFRSKSIRVAGKRTSFHLLENDIIRPRFEEPRIHFALNCASASCPPLHSRAFAAESLDPTLDDLTRAFINTNPLALRSTGPKTIAVSEIFKWYVDDFTTKGTLRDYLNQYRNTPIPTGIKIRYQDYRWTLNEAP